jgi:RNA polymerase sigma-70 factor (ECF subfamily)
LDPIGYQNPLSVSFAIAAQQPETAAVPTIEERIAEREPAAIDEIYREHHTALRGFSRRLVGDHETAEDLVHDVFIALPDAIRRFRGDASLRTFLFAIAVRRGHKFIRSASRRRAAMTRLADQPLAPTLTPDRALQQQQAAETLYRALDRLPDDQRTAFVLCEIDQLTAGDAAVIAGAPEATMRTRLFHARKKLRALLSEEVR